MHYLVCVSGFSGVGKDEFCKRLIDHHGAVQVGTVDPAKRHMADVYGFTEEQLFGPSSSRNAGDLRYPKAAFTKRGLRPRTDPLPLDSDEVYGSVDRLKRYWEYLVPITHLASGAPLISEVPRIPHLRTASKEGWTCLVEEGDPEFWLSPREALQKYCALLDDLHLGTWAKKNAVDRKGLANFGYSYERTTGLSTACARGCKAPALENMITCSADLRHWHDVRAYREAREDGHLPVLVRILSERVPSPPFDHRSETEQLTIPDSEFDFAVRNDGTVEDLHAEADRVVRAFTSPGWKPL